MDRLNRPRFRRPPSGSARLAALVGGLAVWGVASATLAPAASGADRVYWSSSGTFGGPQAISFAGLDGSGGGDFNTTGASLNQPTGIAIDSGTGRLYWANTGSVMPPAGISFANLDGSGGGGDLNLAGATAGNPSGVAVDPAAGRIYWADAGANTISFANLDGSGGDGELNTAGATLSTPVGVAVDPAAGKIYWASPAYRGGSQAISFANLDGSGGGDINTSGATLNTPIAVAVDSAAGRIYWANSGFGGPPETISHANLDGSGGGDLNTAGATLSAPFGVAIDAAAGRIYWANSGATGGSQGVSYANLDGSGSGGDVNTAGATTNLVATLALLKAPLGSGAPKLSGRHGQRSRLSCTQGSWASDQIESLLYRAPHIFTYSWSRNAKRVHGANASTYRPHAVGNYRCTVTAQNQAGEALQTSSAHANFGFGKAVHNKRRGTAKLIVKVPSRGKVILKGKKLQRQSRRTHLASKAKHLHKAALLIRAKGAAKRKLKRSGHAQVKVKVKYKPKGQKAATRARTLTLRFRPPAPSHSANVVFPLGLGG